MTSAHRFSRRARGAGATGFTIIEVIIVVGVLTILFAMGMGYWHDYTVLQRIRYGTVQLATDVRQAVELAKAERAQYTVTLTSGSQDYSILRTGGGFTENTKLPDGVTATASQVVYVSPFGRPVTALGVPTSYSIAIQNPKGTGTVEFTPAGGVTYQEP